MATCLRCAAMQAAGLGTVSSPRVAPHQVVLSRVVARPTHLGRQTCNRTSQSQLQQLRATAEEAVLDQVAAEETPVEAVETEAGSSTAASSGLEFKPAEIEAEYALNVLWLDKSIGLAVDQILKGDQKSPITEYFFWPKTDAWEALNVSIEAKDWISERNRVLLLNLATDVINFWQDEAKKHTIEEAQEKYPQVSFQGN